jgi:hypothetical protein
MIQPQFNREIITSTKEFSFKMSSEESWSMEETETLLAQHCKVYGSIDRYCLLLISINRRVNFF